MRIPGWLVRLGLAAAVALTLGCAPTATGLTPTPASPPAQPAAAPPDPDTAVHGRLESHAGLRLLRLWGTPAQQGYAQGRLLGGEIADLLRREFGARFARREPLLEMLRRALPRTFEFPPPFAAEVDGMLRGMVAAGADLHLADFGRDLDGQDLLVVQALDAIALMGCSGFTVWGDRAEGGGVLTGRNFDWMTTGPHMVDQVLVAVRHRTPGGGGDRVGAVATVTWPGYLGAVTGINDRGVAVFLHVGSAALGAAPEPDSWPTAVAARGILAAAGGGSQVFQRAAELLDHTSPPLGYITRVVLPTVPPDGSPVGLLEADAGSVQRAVGDSGVAGTLVVTNHFQGRDDGRPAARDSTDRAAQVRGGIAACLAADDRRIGPAEGWDLLRSVQRGGRHAFGTLHSLVFRAEPWLFELRLGAMAGDQVVPAPDSPRRFRLSRQQLFPNQW